MFFPTFRYHPTEAPEGRKFTDEAEFNALGPEWVDTPAKLPAPDDAAPTPDAVEPATDGTLTLTRRRGRKPMATVETVQ